MSVQKEPILLIMDALVALHIVQLVAHVDLLVSNVLHVLLIDSFLILIVFNLVLKECLETETLVEVVMSVV